MNEDIKNIIMQNGNKAKQAKAYLIPILEEYEQDIRKKILKANKDELIVLQGQYQIIVKLLERIDKDITQFNDLSKSNKK